MKIAELESRIYKVRIHSTPPLIKSDKNSPKATAHLLFVKGHGEKRTYQLDNGLAADRKHFLVDENEFEVVRRVSQPIINRQSIFLTWKDDEGDDYVFARNRCLGN
jgi:hypothetical protein